MSFEKMFSESKERSRVETIYWAGVFIWAGLVFGANTLISLPQIGSSDAWTWVILGAGLYGTLMNVYYATMSEGFRPRTWDWLWSGFWLVIGLSGFFAIDLFWPLVLLVAGAIALVSAFRRS